MYSKVMYCLVSVLLSVIIIPPCQLFPTQQNFAKKDLASTDSKVCHFGEKLYQIGDWWHPKLNTVAEHCINCTCVEGGMVVCDKQDCPKLDCQHIVTVPDQCCPVCLDNTISLSKQDSEPDLNSEDSEGCNYHGNHYPHASTFPSNKTALRATLPNQCVQCTCLDGDVLCHLKTCLQLTCDKLILVNDDCCPVCEDQSQMFGNFNVSTEPMVTKEDLEIERTIAVNASNTTQGEFQECKLGGRTYQAGETWHPHLEPFGTIVCVTCICQNGAVNCDRLTCDEDLPCEAPVQVKGECCKRCPTESKRSEVSTKATLLLRDEVVPCPPENHEFILMDHKHNDRYTLVLQDFSKRRTHVYKWRVKKDNILEYDKANLNEKQFSKMSHREQLRVVGASTNKFVSRFSRKVQRYLRKCRTSCKMSAIWKLKKKLRLSPVEYKTFC